LYMITWFPMVLPQAVWLGTALVKLYPLQVIAVKKAWLKTDGQYL